MTGTLMSISKRMSDAVRRATQDPLVPGHTLDEVLLLEDPVSSPSEANARASAMRLTPEQLAQYRGQQNMPWRLSTASPTYKDKLARAKEICKEIVARHPEWQIKRRTP